MQNVQEKFTENGKASPCRRYVTLAVCLLECLLFGGSFFGWASLVYVFKADGVFAYLCPDLVDVSLSNVSMANQTTLQNDSSNYTGGLASVRVKSCTQQEERLSLAFTIGLVILGLASLPLGWIFDRYGLLVTRMIGSGLGIGGYIMLAFTSSGGLSWLSYPGVSFVALSCIIIVMTNSHVAQLAGSMTSSFVTLYLGAVNSSGATFLIVKLCQDAGINHRYSLSVLTGLWVIVLLNTWLLLPAYKVSAPGQPPPVRPQRMSAAESQKTPARLALSKLMEQTVAINTAVAHLNNDLGQTTTLGRENREDIDRFSRVGYDNAALQVTDMGDVKVKTLDDTKEKGISSRETEFTQVKTESTLVATAPTEETLRSCVFSSINIIYLYWFCALHVRIQTFLVSFNSWVTVVVGGDLQKVSFYTNLLAYAQACGIFLAPLAGAIMDWRRKAALKRGMTGRRKSFAAVTSIIAACLAGITLSVTSLITIEGCLYFTIFMSEVFRSFMYATAIAFIELTWPASHFGMMFGIAYGVTGGAAMLQYPYIIWSNATPLGFLPLNVFLLVTVIITLIHPAHILGYHYCNRPKNPAAGTATTSPYINVTSF